MRSKLLSLLLLSYTVWSQNLVQNPSFEQVDNCVHRVGQFQQNVKFWSVPTKGTTDLFNSCSQGEIGIPDNFSGIQDVKFEMNYAGCYFYSGKDYREYIQGAFYTTLEKGKKYRFSIYVSLADYSNIAIKNIGVLMSSFPIKGEFEHELSPKKRKDSIKTHYLNIQSEKYLDNKQHWVQISEEFIAQGNEHYITIGNFNKNKETNKKVVIQDQVPNDTSYYYLDMVSVEAIQKEPEHQFNTEGSFDKISNVPKEEVFKMGRIEFEHDRSNLDPSDKEKLKKLQLYLNKHPQYSIKISGHTDATGSSRYNLLLSSERANEVKRYLNSHGILNKRMQVIGLGYTKAIGKNNTSEGRKRNRRVEIEILKLNKD